MALDPSATYPSQIDTTDSAGYPYGKAKNVASLGDGTGTPLEEQWLTDLFGSQQALLTSAGITPSGTPDKVGASQYLDSIKFVGRREQQKLQALSWPERTSFHDPGDSTAPNGSLDMAWAPDLGTGGGGIYVAIAPGNTAGMQVWSSEDGNQFTYRGLNNAANSSVAYGKINGASGFLMTWDAPTGYYTTVTGTSWGSVSATLPAHGVACYSASLGLWVICGDLGVIHSSPTALAGSWTARTTPAPWIAGCGGVKRVVFAAGLFVVLPLGSYNKFLTSPDGINWTERTNAGGTWTGLAYSDTDGLWMATSTGTGLMVSSNGLAWSLQNTAPGGMSDLAVNGPLWVATTINALGGGIAYSTDKGLTWNKVPVGDHSVATTGWNRIISASGRFMIAQSTGTKTELALSQRAL